MMCTVVVMAYVLYSTMDMMIMRKTSVPLKCLMFVIFLMALWLAVRRNTYLPFLAPTVFPPSLVKEPGQPATDHTDHTDHNVHATLKVDAPDGTKVAYWAALPANGVQQTPRIAYEDFSNAGVALVSGGEADVSFFCPAKYVVPWGKTLDRHIHYRVLHANGMMSGVKTTYVNC